MNLRITSFSVYVDLFLKNENKGYKIGLEVSFAFFVKVSFLLIYELATIEALSYMYTGHIYRGYDPIDQHARK